MSAPKSQTTDAVNDKTMKDHEVIHNRITPAETLQTGDVENLKLPVMEQVDRFGAHAKTDPREIKLVRKLDRYIMVRHETSSTPIIDIMY
jgi:hypothetical protein